MPDLSNLGTKYECFSCGTRFYDLNKPEPICPKCGANQKDSDRGESPASSGSAARKKRKVEPPKPIVIEEEEAPIEDIADEEIAVGEVEIEGIEDDEEEEEDFDDED